MTPASQAELLGASRTRMEASSPADSQSLAVHRTFGESSQSSVNVGGGVAGSDLSSRRDCVSDVERRATETQALVKVIAVSDDGSHSCSFDFDTSLSTFSDFESLISRQLGVNQFICTYSTSPQFLKMHSVNPYRQQMLTSDLELSCAIMSTSIGQSPRLYVRAHRNLGGDGLLLTSSPRSLRIGSMPTQSGGDSWDLLDDSKDVQRLWRRLPSSTDVPFARLLRWQQHQPQNQVARTVQSFTHSLPLHSFEWQSFLDPVGRLVREADFRLRVYHGGVEPDFRPNVWRHIAYVFPPRLTMDEREAFLARRREEYFQLRNKWKSNPDPAPPVESLMTTIHNDVIRTDRRIECYVSDDSPYLQALFNVLLTFALNDPEISYVQGLNDIASIILQVYQGDEADTYIVFRSLMHCSTSLFTPEGLSLKSAYMMALLQRFDSVFYDYLCDTNSQDLFFTYRWLLLDLKREFHPADVPRLFEVMWSTLPPPPQYLNDLHFTPPDEGLEEEDPSVISLGEALSATALPAGTDVDVDVTLRNLGNSPSSAWAVIDCIPAPVGECTVNEVPANGQHSLSDIEEAGDATNLQLLDRCESTAADSGVPPDALLGDGSLHGSEWDVIEESDVVCATSRRANSRARPAKPRQDVVITGALSTQSDPIAVRDPVNTRPIDPNVTLLTDACDLDEDKAFPKYGNPFTLFMCLALLLEHRNKIMKDHIVEESIAIYFDQLRSCHNLSSLVEKARTLLETFVASDLMEPHSPASSQGASVLL